MQADQRFEQIKNWLDSDLALQNYQINSASADASFRRYFRVTENQHSWIIMDAPPQHEDCQPFIKVANLLEDAGVHAPHIYDFNESSGFMRLSDLGSKAYLDVLDDQNSDLLYEQAIQSIVKMQTIHAELPVYNQTLLLSEMNLFKDWFLGTHMKIELDSLQSDELDKIFLLLSDHALQQTTGFVHRDYHSRNLMYVDDKNPGVIDFQDAVNGPVSYDLVSLLKDCYIAWPRSKQLQWIDSFLQQSSLNIDRELFIKQFDFMGMQRHLKAIGIFARLNYRDAKSNYLDDIPRTMAYVFDVCQRYQELEPFQNLMQTLNVLVQKDLLEAIQ